MESQDVYWQSRLSLIDLISNMYKMAKDLIKKEAEIRLELRKHKRYRGKVNDKVLDWLVRADRIKSLLFDPPDQCETQFDLLQEANLLFIVEVIKSLLGASQLLVMNHIDVGVQYRRPKNSDMSSQPLVGKSAQVVSDQIWECLMDTNIQTIGIYGRGGVGKTTIMKNISNQLESTQNFDKVIWVTLSKFKSLKDFQDITNFLTPKSLKDVKKFLLVLDDVWTLFDLVKIGISNLRTVDGCKLVVITRFQYVAMELEADKTINLVPLTMNEAWDLFVNKSGNQVLDPEIESIAQEIVFECKGLPITIITVAHAMREEVRITIWRKALGNLRSTLENRKREGMEDMKRVSDLLRFGYNHLKNDQVRECFICCAFYPKDYNFEVQELIEYWLAEDFLNTGEDILTSINRGREILKELTDANMLEWVWEGNDELLRMPLLYRDLAINIMEERYNIFPRAALGLKEFPFNAGYTGAKKISLVGNLIEELDTNPMCFLLSTLLLQHNPLSRIPSSFFQQVPRLQVLDLSYSGIAQLPESLSGLSKLRALLLRYCTSLRKMPSIGDLRDLKILNLRGTLIKEVPRGIERLNGLKSLDLSDTLLLDSLQHGLLSSLANLEELHMQGSRLCKMETETVANFFKEIRCLEKLVILTLSAVGFEDHLETIVHLQGYNLRSFSINIYGSTQDYAEDM